jgi:excisionase family DNA binding protein
MGMALHGHPRPVDGDFDLPALLTPEDVAAFFNVPRRTVYQWIDSGLLPSYRVGPRLLRILRQDVLSLLRRLPVSDELGADTPDEDGRH